MGFREALGKLVVSIDKYNCLTVVKISKCAGFKTLYSLSWKLDKPQTLVNVAVTQGHYTSHCIFDAQDEYSLKET